MNKKGKKAVIKRFAAMLATVCFAAMLCVSAGCTVMPAPNENQVALVGKTYYEDLGEAISAAKSGEIVTLFKDVDLSDTLVIENKKLLLDLNGKTIYNTGNIWCVKNENSWSLVSVRGGGELTITGNGKMLAKENDCYTIDIVDGGKLVIENGTFVGNITAVYAHTGTAEIKGGTYRLLQDMSYQDTVNPNKYLLNCLDDSFAAGTASITVIGGTFDKFDPARSFEKDRVSFLSDGYKSVANENGTYTVVAE
ncbi:MAG: hypothetical protein HP008_06565 [Clostridia bacterium]|nr:hypothetical protein [Clostridia bacterium]